MDRFQNEIVLFVNHIGLRTGITSPQQIYQMLAMLGQCLDSCIGKLLPTQCRVTIRHVGTNGQCSVKQQHALFSPTRQIARSGNRCTEGGNITPS